MNNVSGVSNNNSYPSPRATFMVLVGLAVLTIISLGLLIDRQGAMGDFWYVVTQFEDKILTSWQWDTTRPLVGIVWELLWMIFGYHFLGWYVVLIVTQALCAMLLWHLLWRYFNVQWAVAAFIAAFFLLYPSDSAHLYIGAITNRHATLCGLLAAWTWLAARQPGVSRRKLILLSILCVVLLTATLLLYEGPLGLALVFPILVLVLNIGSIRIGAVLRQWRWLAVWYTGIALFMLYRLVLEPILPKIINPQLVDLSFSPARIAQQASYWPATTLWNGWLYAPLAATQIGSPVLLIVVTLLIAVGCFLLYRKIPTFRRAFFVKILVVGLVLWIASAFPILISTLDVSTMAGTLYGRTLSSVAFGQALIIVGLIGWLSSSWRALGAVLITVLMSLATAESIGLQYIYANVWLSQVRVIEALEKYAPNLPDNSTIVLLNVPSGPDDLRYAFPFTRLVRVLYGNKTLQVAPWLANYPPDQQLFVFGDKSLVIVETLDELATIDKPYQNVVAFRYNGNGPLTPVTNISSQYLLPASKTWFVNPKVIGRQSPFDLSPTAGPSTAQPESSLARPALIGYCQYLVNACH